jgi:hypothetical protein
METWSSDQEWPFTPSGDGKSCRFNPPLSDRLANVGIRVPLFDLGYRYTYTSGGQFTRTPCPSFEVVREICLISKELRNVPECYDTEAIAFLVEDLNHHCHRVPTPALMAIISPESLQPLIQMAKALDNSPTGLVERLERLSVLHGQLVY